MVSSSVKSALKSSVRVSAPATIANLGPGYDVIGMALNEPRDFVEVSLESRGEDFIEVEGVRSESISCDPKKNSALVAGRAVLERAGRGDLCLKMKVIKGVPPRSGLGSSGASSAAGAYSVNVLLGMPLKDEELLQCAMEGERAACGSPHADNVAPALFGGVVFISSFKPIKVIRFEALKDLEIVVITPEVEIGEEKTKIARQILPTSVPLQDMVRQTQAFGKLLVGLMNRDVALMGEGVSGDVVIERARAKLIPKFDYMKSCALEAGAYGFSISGAGPSVFALCPNNMGKQLGATLKSILEKDGIRSSYSVHRNVGEGVKVVS
ncbi:MAG: homoserine kinase [Candidatus Methanomethyliaceae archaeon]|nr:homoserine kinase [Candidatus Methanomethyliaceae archaeon]